MAVNISKEPRIRLDKGGVVNITKDGKEDSSALGKVYCGISWGKIKVGGIFGFLADWRSVDLDASVFCYTRQKTRCDMIYYGNKQNLDRTIVHSGDDLHGGGDKEKDNETVMIDLTNLPYTTETIVVAINSYSGETFDKIPFVRARIYTGSAGEPDDVLCEYRLDGGDAFKGKTSMVLGHFFRSGQGWKFKADGHAGTDTRVTQMSGGLCKSVI